MRPPPASPQAHAHLPFVVVPRPVAELTTARVLTLEWVDGQGPQELAAGMAEGPGERAASVARLKRMVALGVECSLSQMLETGVMHADPHPGNLRLTRDGQVGGPSQAPTLAHPRRPSGD